MDKKLEQALKPELRYDVRNATPPGQEETTFYPAIVTTLPVKSMDDIVKDMDIDTPSKRWTCDGVTMEYRWSILGGRTDK